MYRDRRLLLVVPVLAFFVIAVSLYTNSAYLSRVVQPTWHVPSWSATQTEKPSKEPQSSPQDEPPQDELEQEFGILPVTETQQPTAASVHVSPSPSPTPTLPKLHIGNGTILQSPKIEKYVSAILDPASTTFKLLQCPALNETRYATLKSSSLGDGAATEGFDYFFALNLRNNLEVLPRLLGSIVEAIQFLGSERCALSIVEGNSPDGTADVLKAIAPFFERLNIPYFYASSDIDPKKGNRIAKLAELRNLALQPIFEQLKEAVDSDTTVLFINDVAACAEDILELALQRQKLGADMTCGMDWTYVGPDPTFYDVWVARGINGDSFFEIPDNGSWDSAWNLFWNDADTKTRLMARKPFQVYSCWNGAAAFSAAPLLEGVRFRDAKKGHCRHGEPQNFCKDLWAKGYGKIAVIPTVNLEYSNEKAIKIKKLKGYVSGLTRTEKEADSVIEWTGPPEEVKCIHSWGEQFWKPWKVSRREFISSLKM